MFILARDTETFVAKVTASLGRCFRILFSVHVGLRASTTSTLRVFSRTSSQRLNGVHFKAQKCKIHRLVKCLSHCGFRRIVCRLKPSIMTIIKDFCFPEFDRKSSSDVSKRVSERGFPLLAFSSSTAIIPPCLGILACRSTDHCSNKFWTMFALAFRVRRTCHWKRCCFYSRILSWIRAGKKGSSVPCKLHLGADTARTFWMALVSSSTHLSIAMSSDLPDFPLSVSEASLECCPVRHF